MPEIESKNSYSEKLLTVKNYLLLLPLVMVMIACSAGNNDTAKAKPGSYSFTSLIAHNSFYTPPTEEQCPNIPTSAINSDPNLQLPEPDCAVGNSTAQIANGCIVESNNLNQISTQLSKSVVGIAVPTGMVRGGTAGKTLTTICTGTFIESNWVLTATHCLVDSGKFNHYAESIVIVPWQKKFNGLPQTPKNKFKPNTALTLRIKNIFIPRVFPADYFKPGYGGMPADIALIELESSLPAESYTPLAIESKHISLHENDLILRAGYGMINGNKQIDGKLYYKNSYFYSNLYDINNIPWPGQQSQPGPSLNSGADYGMIYTLGTAPAGSSTGSLYSWSFISSGDSGSPLLQYDPVTHKPTIIGVTGGGLFCEYPGYYAALPYPLDQSTAIESYYPLIQQIINKTVNQNDVRCVPEATCMPKIKMVYVLSNQNNSISMYNENPDNNKLEYKSRIMTSMNPRAFAIDKNRNYILVANYGNGTSGSISVFRISSNGLLTSTQSPQEFSMNEKLVDITASNRSYPTPKNNNIFVAGKDIHANYIVSRLALNSDTGALTQTGKVTIPGQHTISKLKLYNGELFAIDTIGNTIYKVYFSDQSTLALSNGFNLPTDLIPYGSSKFLVVDSGNNRLADIMYPDTFHYDSGGTEPYQVLKRSYGFNSFLYVTNIQSSNIAIFQMDQSTENIPVLKTRVGTGSDPISMAMTDHELFEINDLDDTIWRYNIQSNGNLTVTESMQLGVRPIAVLTNYNYN